MTHHNDRTPKDHRDVAALTEAHEEALSMVSHANEKARAADLHDELQVISNSLVVTESHTGFVLNPTSVRLLQVQSFMQLTFSDARSGGKVKYVHLTILS